MSLTTSSSWQQALEEACNIHDVDNQKLFLRVILAVVTIITFCSYHEPFEIYVVKLYHGHAT